MISLPRMTEFGTTTSSSLWSAEIRYQQSHLLDLPDMFADFYAISKLKGSAIRHAVAGNDIAYE